MSENRRTVWLYLPEQWADWETGFLTAELNTGRLFAQQDFHRPVRTFARTAAPVTSMGGLRALPEHTVEDLEPEHAAALILPGGNAWQESYSGPILGLAEAFLEQGKPVAAICGAVQGLAAAGMLDHRPHTGNAAEVLEGITGYRGANWYREEAVVSEGGLITAGSIAAVQFAAAVMRAIGGIRPETIAAWTGLHETGEPHHYTALVDSLSG